MKTQQKQEQSQDLPNKKEDENYLFNVNRMIKLIPAKTSQEDYRVACSIISGFYSNKSLLETIKYYSLDQITAKNWWEFFSFDCAFGNENRPRKGSKSQALDSFVKENIGKTFKSNEILVLCDITNPTLYNYINSNRGAFKKVGRGCYEILDPSEERSKAKKKN